MEGNYKQKTIENRQQVWRSNFN